MSIAIATFATLAGGLDFHYTWLFYVLLTLSRAIGISVGENILVSQLLREVPRYARTIPPEAVIASGALNLTSLTTSPPVLHGLRHAYSRALSAVMICATAAIGISVLATLGMQRVNLVKVSRGRELASDPARPVGSSATVTEDGKQDHNVSPEISQSQASDAPG